MWKYVIPIPAVALAFLLSGCNVITGSGNVIAETREVRNFDRVALTGSGDAVITQGSEEALTIEVEDNLLPYIRSEIRNGTLFLGFNEVARGSIIRTRRPLRFYLTVRNVASLEVSGSGNISALDLRSERMDLNVNGSGNVIVGPLVTEELAVTINGSGNIDLTGQATDQEVSINGSGNYRAPELASRTATVRVMGSGDATLRTQDSLDVAISGSGDVGYYGSPQITSRITGSGNLNNLGN
jgi:predicted small secreted protein